MISWDGSARTGFTKPTKPQAQAAQVHTSSIYMAATKAHRSELAQWPHDVPKPADTVTSLQLPSSACQLNDTDVTETGSAVLLLQPCERGHWREFQASPNQFIKKEHSAYLLSFSAQPTHFYPKKSEFQERRSPFTTHLT